METQTIGDRIREARLGMALTQAQLAEKAGVSTDGVMKVEGGRSYPRPTTVQKLAMALEVPASYLTRGEIRMMPDAPDEVMSGSDQGGAREDEMPARAKLLAMKARLDVLLGRKDILAQGVPSGIPRGTPPASRPEIQHERNTGAAVIDQRR